MYEYVDNLHKFRDTFRFDTNSIVQLMFLNFLFTYSIGLLQLQKYFIHIF